MRDPKERLKNIVDAIAKIQRYAVQGREAFEQEELIQTWILYHIQLIGTVERDLPVLRHQIEALVKRLEDQAYGG